MTLALEEAAAIAVLLHGKGALDEAEGLYRRILGVSPGYQDALHFLAVLCHQRGREEEAEDLIRRILSIDPGNADARNNLGNVLEGTGRSAEAEKCYREAIALAPRHASARNNLAVLLAGRGDTADAVASYRSAIELSPGSADFRCNLGNALRRAGEAGEALLAYRGALERDPRHDAAWQGLARTLLHEGRRDDAARAYDEWLRVDPGNAVAAYLKAACVGDGVPERAPDAYVEKVFDEMASVFDSHLEGLGYRAPALVAEALAAALPLPAASLDILDAGCGTGLLSPLLRPYARLLAGVDLSSGMLARAAGRGGYDGLVQAELTEFLGRTGEVWDAVVSADTLCYFGKLEPVLRSAAFALRKGGVLAFTLEDGGDGEEEFRLLPQGRYAHSRGYLRRALEAAGFSLQSLSEAPLRREGGEEVAGLVALAILPG